MMWKAHLNITKRDRKKIEELVALKEANINSLSDADRQIRERMSRPVEFPKEIPIDAFIRWIDIQIWQLKNFKNNEKKLTPDALVKVFEKWREETAQEIGNSLDPALNWESKFRKCQYHTYSAEPEFHISSLIRTPVDQYITRCLDRYSEFLVQMKKDVRAPHLLAASRWMRNGS